MPFFMKWSLELMGAAYFGHQDIAAILLDHGADINKKDSRGSVPLRFAIDQRNESMATFLIEKGASIKVKDKIGNTLLLYTVLNNNLKIILLIFF